MRADHRRWLLFAALYFAEGAPIGWLWWALPSQLRQAGLEVSEITALTAALAIPWTLKFLWAPLVDVLRTPRFGFRGWLVAAQLGMATCLVPLLFLDPIHQWGAVTACLLLHAFCAATQDVAIDALAIHTVPTGERGRLNGAMQLGMIGGRLAFSTGLLFAAARLGEDGRPATLEHVLPFSVALLLGVLVATGIAAWFAPTVPVPASGPRIRAQRRRYLRVALRSGRLRRLALFALVAGLGFEAAGALSGTWLVDAGYDGDAIATFRLVTALAMAAGAVAGGIWADRSGSGGVAAVALPATAGLVALTAITGSVAAYALVYLVIGVFTAVSYALFMRASTGPFAASAFSAFMGLTNGCEAAAGWLAGQLHAAAGYGPALLILAAASLGAWPLIPRGRRENPGGASAL